MLSRRSPSAALKPLVTTSWPATESRAAPPAGTVAMSFIIQVPPAPCSSSVTVAFSAPGLAMRKLVGAAASLAALSVSAV